MTHLWKLMPRSSILFVSAEGHDYETSVLSAIGRDVGGGLFDFDFNNLNLLLLRAHDEHQWNAPLYMAVANSRGDCSSGLDGGASRGSEPCLSVVVAIGALCKFDVTDRGSIDNFCIAGVSGDADASSTPSVSECSSATNDSWIRDAQVACLVHHRGAARLAVDRNCTARSVTGHKSQSDSVR
jgi:hypothetical protein